MALAEGTGTKNCSFFLLRYLHSFMQSIQRHKVLVCGRGGDEAGLSRGEKSVKNSTGRVERYFFFISSLSRLFHLSCSPSLALSLSLNPGPFRAEGGAARNEAARAVAAPRGGVAVVLCSSTSASTMSRSGGGREADAGLLALKRATRTGRASDKANCWPRESQGKKQLC